MEVGSLPNHVNSCVICMCLLFYFRLFTVIDLSPGVLFAQQQQIIRARLVIEFKNCCLKRCENYSLKSVIEIRVFGVYKTKKCVWYHGLNNMF